MWEKYSMQEKCSMQTIVESLIRYSEFEFDVRELNSIAIRYLNVLDFS